jgi:1-acyl-sn-glycerol-3-phosphate acyltransferase
MARRLATQVLPPDVLARIDALPLDDLGHGFDAFGMTRDGVADAVALVWPAYAGWFRVTSHGAGHVPTTGPTVLAANHSGTLPLDAMLLCVDVLVHAPSPRVPRAVLDHFVGRLPMVGRAFARAGAVSGSRSNLHHLLSHGELVLVFPEGTAGIGKPFSSRYQLQRWREGHAELAIRHGAAVVPVAIVGAEEVLPQLGRIDLHWFGAPWLPIPATLVPLPVHVHVWYGEPLRFPHPPEAADDPAIVDAAAAQVRDAVQRLIRRGLAERPGIFA